MSNTDQVSLETALNEFYIEFPYTRVNVMDKSISYKVPFGYQDEVRKEAQELIDRHGWPLVARTHSTHGIFRDVVMIEPKEGV